MSDKARTLADALRMAQSFDPAGYWYDFSRPKLQNADGSFSTEETITVGFGDRYYNIPTIWNGKRVPEDVAVSNARAAMQRGTVFPNFANPDEADKQAGLRSDWRGHLGRMGVK